MTQTTITFAPLAGRGLKQARDKRDTFPFRFRPARGARIETSTGLSHISSMTAFAPLAGRGLKLDWFSLTIPCQLPFAPLAGRGLKQYCGCGPDDRNTFRPARGARIETAHRFARPQRHGAFAPLAGRGLKPLVAVDPDHIPNFRPARGARIETN